jgi:hypothetical protein
MATVSLLAPTYLSTLRDEIIDEVLQKKKKNNARQQPSSHQPGSASFRRGFHMTRRKKRSSEDTFVLVRKTNNIDLPYQNWLYIQGITLLRFSSRPFNLGIRAGARVGPATCRTMVCECLRGSATKKSTITTLLIPRPSVRPNNTCGDMNVTVAFLPFFSKNTPICPTVYKELPLC